MGSLLIRREHWRQWFEFYKLALASADPGVRERLAKSAKFYERWGDVRGEKFDAWWKSHAYLFEGTTQVHVLKEGELPRQMDSLVVEIPLNQSPTKLLAAVRLLIEEQFARKNYVKRKGRTTLSTPFRLSDNAEPKLAAIRERLTFYRDIYLRNPGIRGRELLVAIQRHYTSRKRSNKVPMAIRASSFESSSGDYVRAMRNVRRYVHDARAIIVNVAGGQFPGKY